MIIIFIIIFVVILIYLVNKDMKKDIQNIDYQSKNLSYTEIIKDEILEEIDKKLDIFIKKQINMIKSTNSLDVINKRFNIIYDVLCEKQPFKPILISLPIGDYTLIDIKEIKPIQQYYIKYFINNKVDLELNKLNFTESRLLREQIINKIIRFLLKSIEFLPNDPEISQKIKDMEKLLTEIY